MAQIAYGQNEAPGLPPVNLPSLNDDAQPPQAPLRITISKAAQPETQTQGIGPFKAYAPPSEGTTNAAPQDAGQSSDSGVGPFAAYNPPSETPPDTREFGVADTVARGVVNGLTFGTAPVIAGLARAGEQNEAKAQEAQGVIDNPSTGQEAGGVGIAEPFIGAYRMIADALSSHPDPEVRKAYDTGRSDALAAEKLAQQQHPYAYLGGQLAAGLALPISGGLGGATTLGRIATSARSGAIAGGLYGAGDAASEGGGVSDLLKGAAGGVAAGAALGGAAGSAIEGATGLTRRVASVLRGSRDEGAEAGTKVLSAMVADKPQVMRHASDREALTAASEAGTPVYNVDLGGENTRALLRSAANISPSARNMIHEKLKSRYDQQADRFSTWIKSKFGGGDKEGDLAAIKAQARKENAPNYKAAERQADALFPKGVWSPKLEQLLGSNSVPQALETAIKNGRDRAVAEGHGAFNPKVTFQNGILKSNKAGGVQAYPDLRLWDYTQRELRDMATSAQRKGLNEQADALFALHRQLLTELDRLVPSFGKARGTAAKFFKASDALDAGANFVKDGTIGNVEAARQVAKMTPAERNLFARGFATALANEIEQRGYRSDVLNNIFLSSPRAEARIRIALGEDGARQFEALMRVERMVNEARLALGNSTTVRQSHEAGMAGAGAVGLIESFHGALNPVYIVAGGLILGGRAAARHIDDKVAVKVAEMLLSDNPAVLAKGYKIVSSNPVMRDALRRASDVSARQIINYMRPSGVGAAALTAIEHVRPGEHTPHHITDDQYGDGYQGASPH